MVEFEAVRQLIGEILQLDHERLLQMSRETALQGSIPEFDSMAVVLLLNALEEHFGIHIEDDEISAEDFESFGAVYALVCAKAQVN